MDQNEESKNEKGGNMRTGDKYIIRKLVSTKILPDQIQDFINMILNGSSGGGANANGYQMNYPTPNVNINQQDNLNNNFIPVPQPSTHMRSNS